ncbi:solute carrier family 22 member 4-like isoform X1 [Amblyomma americanum]
MASTNVDVVLDNLSFTHAIIFVFAFLRGLPATWNLMMPVFMAPSNFNFRCADGLGMASNWTSLPTNQLWANYSLSTAGNDTEQCFRSPVIENEQEINESPLEPCTSWDYDHSIYGKTVSEEWNMVCGDRWMNSLVRSVYMAGIVVGTVASSQISDWFGRKRTMIGGLLLSVGASAMSAFCTSAAMYYASRFAVALGISGFADVIYTLTMETVSPRYRYLPTITIDMGWTTGMLLLPWLHYLTREWRATQLYASLPLAPLLALSCFLPESPRWLMATGRFRAAKQVVTKFTKNSRGTEGLVDEITEEAKRTKAAARDVRRASVADLFSTKAWAALTALFSFQQVVYGLMWYHMTVSTAVVGGDPYVNFTVGASSEYPVRLVNAMLVKYCRRRRTVCGSFCFSALVLVVLWLVPPEHSWVRLGLLMAGKVGTSVSGTVMRVQQSEMYPTVVRSVAMGFCNTMGWLGSVVAPFFDDLGHVTQSWVPNAMAAGLCAAGAGCSLLLPESYEKTLDDSFTAQDGAAKWSQLTRPLRDQRGRKALLTKKEPSQDTPSANRQQDSLWKKLPGKAKRETCSIEGSPPDLHDTLGHSAAEEALPMEVVSLEDDVDHFAAVLGDGTTDKSNETDV